MKPTDEELEAARDDLWKRQGLSASRDDIEKMWSAIAPLVLERAAKVCDELRGGEFLDQNEMRLAAARCAGEIRELAKP